MTIDQGKERLLIHPSDVHLTREEQQAMRSALIAAMEQEPTLSQTDHANRRTGHFFSRLGAAAALWRQRLAYALAGVALMAFLGGSYALAHSQPGSLLYPLKRKIQRYFSLNAGERSASETDSSSTTLPVTNPTASVSSSTDPFAGLGAMVARAMPTSDTFSTAQLLTTQEALHEIDTFIANNQGSIALFSPSIQAALEAALVRYNTGKQEFFAGNYAAAIATFRECATQLQSISFPTSTVAIPTPQLSTTTVNLIENELVH